MKKFNFMEKVGIGLMLSGVALMLGMLMHCCLPLGCVMLGFVMSVAGIVLVANSKD